MNMGVLVGVPLVSALVLAWMYPVLATDVFAHQAQARVFWLFHDNPYLTPPSAYPFVLHMYWLDRPTVYGPLWTLLTGLPLLLGGGHHLIEVVLFKLMAGGAVVGAAVVIARAVRATRPGWEPTAVVLFAWNPFTLVRTAGMGHNDIVMVFLPCSAMTRSGGGGGPLRLGVDGGGADEIRGRAAGPAGAVVRLEPRRRHAPRPRPRSGPGVRCRRSPGRPVLRAVLARPGDLS
ncbi:MAG: hypothetical protein U0531_19065 [Dehalococcoidia bacterium]